MPRKRGIFYFRYKAALNPAVSAIRSPGGMRMPNGIRLSGI